MALDPPSVPVTTFPCRAVPGPAPLLMLRKPLILSLECLYRLNSGATCDRQLQTVSNSKLLGTKACCSHQQKYDSAGFACFVKVTWCVCFLSLVCLCTPPLLYVHTECVAGRFGADCQHQCECENGGQCDRQTGRCSCSAGWIGQRCEKGEPVRLYSHKANGPTEAVTSRELLHCGNCWTGNMVFFCLS